MTKGQLQKDLLTILDRMSMTQAEGIDEIRDGHARLAGLIVVLAERLANVEAVVVAQAKALEALSASIGLLLDRERRLLGLDKVVK